ncbi:MAG TPA: hypothetical protein EYN58_03285 [Candidatus Poseidoniales archaeon]|nr:MAG: hypothetical protein CXX81_25220 [Euryarchaeota archaeon]HHZ74199.1 hypothetical protein [Candidatus Poseidoniales archaeon]PXY76285.1 MAG: hypothetical protein CXX81_15325 [Euryarchaeota archaeon]PXY77791.1 MAG: hypothetical protein CXX81_11070 [Euryarchaeota archaeon]PXY79619.1 MAG: hypothetical protein CXX81_01885 [Euryarchaeota archaeon]
MTEDEPTLDDLADERDVNDWLEMFWGSLLIVIGLNQLMHPGSLFAPVTMQWLGSGVIALGLAWVGHGLKDMAVKEIRTSLVASSPVVSKRVVDYGLIRDVLLHPDQYGKFLLEAYHRAYEDGVLTQDEHDELTLLSAALEIPPRQAARIATRAAIKCAVQDGKVTTAEMALIEGAMQAANLTEEERGKIRDALDDGIIDDEEKKMLDDILGSID